MSDSENNWKTEYKTDKKSEKQKENGESENEHTAVLIRNVKDFRKSEQNFDAWSEWLELCFEVKDIPKEKKDPTFLTLICMYTQTWVTKMKHLSNDFLHKSS